MFQTFLPSVSQALFWKFLALTWVRLSWKLVVRGAKVHTPGPLKMYYGFRAAILEDWGTGRGRSNSLSFSLNTGSGLKEVKNFRFEAIQNSPLGHQNHFELKLFQDQMLCVFVFS